MDLLLAMNRLRICLSWRVILAAQTYVGSSEVHAHANANLNDPEIAGNSVEPPPLYYTDYVGATRF